METKNTTAITVETSIQSPVAKVWRLWNDPGHIVNWYFASDDWHAPYAENDLKEGGKFKTTMSAKDGSRSFDFTGVYSKVTGNELIEYILDDGRKVSVSFMDHGDETRVVETFETENTYPVEVQRSGWQAILDNFKKYVETTR